MELTLKTLRTLGFEKIYNYYVKRGINDRLEDVYYITQGMTLPSYSFLQYYKLLSEKESLFTKGYRSFCLKAAPLLDIEENPIEAEKRRFRNSTNYIFDTLLKIDGVDEVMVQAYKSIMLSLPFIERYIHDAESRERLKKVCIPSSLTPEKWMNIGSIYIYFFDDILSWYLLTSSEETLSENGLTMKELLANLITKEDGFRRC